MVAKFLNSVKAWNGHQHLGRLLPILAAYFALAFYGLDRQSLWEDEYLSVLRIASSSPIWKDGHGFLYFALLRLWAKMGTSEFVLRSLSVLLGGMAICLTYIMGAILCNRRVAVVGATLLATSPFFIWYSQEVRYVTLMLVTTLLTMYAFHRVIAGGRLWWWLVYGSTVLLSIFSFILTPLVPIAQGLYLSRSPSRRLFVRKWVVCQAAIFVLFMWWIINGTHFWQAFMETAGSGPQTVFFDPKQKVMVDYTPLPPAAIPYTFFALSTGFSLGPSLQELHTGRFAALAPHAWILLLTCSLFAGLSLSGLRALWRQREAGLLLTLWIGVPIIGILGLSILVNVIYSVRYVAMVLPAYMLLLALGIVRFRRPVVQMTLCGVVLIVHAVALANYYFDPRYAREDVRAAAQLLEATAGAKDAILVVGTMSSLPYYYNRDLPMTNLSALARDAHKLADRVQEFGARHDGLWLVQIRPWQTDRMGRVKAALDEAYPLIEYHRFPGVDIYHYQVSK